MQKLNLINNRGRNWRRPGFKKKVAQGMQRQLKFVVFQEFVEQIEKRVISSTYQHRPKILQLPSSSLLTASST